MKQEFFIESIKDWQSLAIDLAKVFVPGDILALEGDLGVGKTTFTQALAKALNSRTEPKSPTFSLMRTYQVKTLSGIKRLIHIDAYRIETEEDFRVLDVDEELAQGDALLALEWPERVAVWLQKHSYYRMQITQAEKGRKVIFEKV